MFECVVCGVCTKDALVYSVANPRAWVIAVCGPHCRRAFRRDSSRYFADHAESGGGD